VRPDAISGSTLRLRPADPFALIREIDRKRSSRGTSFATSFAIPYTFEQIGTGSVSDEAVAYETFPFRGT
jgi:hypothetical protein